MHPPIILKTPPRAPKPLHKDVFNSWTRHSIFSDEDIQPYKSLVEDINRRLATVGRALGHRVWQSIELYMANHPKVIDEQHKLNEGQGSQANFHQAMKEAFEDQLVQKVMPKLRGIESRGQGLEECLEPIERLLSEQNYSITEDFKNACHTEFGQFMWHSAEYLYQTDNEISESLSTTSTQSETPQPKADDTQDEMPITSVSPPVESVEQDGQSTIRLRPLHSDVSTPQPSSIVEQSEESSVEESEESSSDDPSNTPMSGSFAKLFSRKSNK